MLGQYRSPVLLHHHGAFSLIQTSVYLHLDHQPPTQNIEDDVQWPFGTVQPDERPANIWMLVTVSPGGIHSSFVLTPLIYEGRDKNQSDYK